MARTKQAADAKERGPFVPRGYAASVKDLQRALGHAAPNPEPEPPPQLTWLRGAFLRRGLVEAVTLGAQLAIRLVSGAVYVGEVIFAGARWIQLRLWGVSEPRRFDRAAIAGAKLVPSHHWRDASAVARRQARGEPALIVNGKEEP
jgi:hypothetical protein